MNATLYLRSFSNITGSFGYILNFPGDHVALKSFPKEQVDQTIKKVTLRTRLAKTYEYCLKSERGLVLAGMPSPLKEQRWRIEIWRFKKANDVQCKHGGSDLGLAVIKFPHELHV